MAAIIISVVFTIVLLRFISHSIAAAPILFFPCSEASIGLFWIIEISTFKTSASAFGFFFL